MAALAAASSPPTPPLSPVEATSSLIAASRYAISLVSPEYLNDTYAEYFTDTTSPPAPCSPLSLSRIAVRTRFFDTVLSQTLPHVAQILILAAGCDMRAYRLPIPPELPIFEVDLPSVITYKQRVLSTIPALPPRNVTHVSLDLISPSFLQTLAATTSFDPTKPTLILAEGLLYYFPPPQASSTLAQLAILPSSLLCFSAVSPPASTTSKSRGLGELFKWRTNDPAETARSAGWTYSRAFTYRDKPGGCDSYLETLSPPLPNQPSPTSTFYTIATTSPLLFTPFSPPSLPPPKPLPNNTTCAVIVCGKALVDCVATAELEGRVERAVQLCDGLRDGGCNVTLILSGGRGEAEEMQRVLDGMKNSTTVACVEKGSNTTRQNAVECKKLVGDTVTMVYVVTSGYHVKRAVHVFKREWRAGIEVEGYGDFWTVGEKVQKHEDGHRDRPPDSEVGASVE